MLCRSHLVIVVVTCIALGQAQNSSAETTTATLGTGQTTLQSEQKITKPDSQGFGSEQCEKCGSDLDPAIIKEGFNATSVTTCFLPFGLSKDAGISGTVFECECKSPFNGPGSNGISCSDVNECTENTDWCDNNAFCENTVGSFKCTCYEGYYTTDDGKTCIDVDECNETVYGGPICGAGDAGKCTNLKTTYECDCNEPGFRPGKNEKGDDSCLDVDECKEGTAVCNQSHRGICNNTYGSYECLCEEAYTLSRSQFRNIKVDECVDVNECLKDALNDCHPDADCTNSDGGYSCFCKKGFEGNGKQCSDEDECVLGTDDCSDDAQCTNTIGGYTCTCNTGFSGDGKTCEDINECTTTDSRYKHNCDQNAACTNSIGSFSCKCNSGFRGDDGTVCKNIDECFEKLDNCDGNAVCTDLTPLFSCACIRGYTGDGKQCTEVADGLSQLKANKTKLESHSTNILIYEAMKQIEKLKIEKEILLRECEQKELRGNGARKRRGVVNIPEFKGTAADSELLLLQREISRMNWENHQIKTTCTEP